ncbi:hypothetical protein Dip510_001352 [Elusimicrobium posterum]|uniref:hypothetical protein n=1 Tax=Elusimicrobium posterum TaxID=3116653 RepID=UPI003C7126E6
MPKKILAHLMALGLLFVQFPSELFAQKAIQAVTYYPTPYGAYMNVDANTVVVKDALEVNTLNDVTKLDVAGTLTGSINRLEADNAVVKSLSGTNPTIKATKKVHVSNESEVAGIVAGQANVANTFYLDGLAFPYAKAINPNVSNMVWKQITYYTDKTNKKTATRTFLVLEDVGGSCTVERIRRTDLDIEITTKDEFTEPDLSKYLAKDTCNQNFNGKFTCGDGGKKPESCIDYTLGTSRLGQYHQPDITTKTVMSVGTPYLPAPNNNGMYMYNTADTRKSGGSYNSDTFYISVPSDNSDGYFEREITRWANSITCENICYTLMTEQVRQNKGLQMEREYFDSVDIDVYTYELPDHCVFDIDPYVHTFTIEAFASGYGSFASQNSPAPDWIHCSPYVSGDNSCKRAQIKYTCSSPDYREEYYDDYTYVYHANEVKCCPEEAKPECTTDADCPNQQFGNWPTNTTSCAYECVRSCNTTTGKCVGSGIHWGALCTQDDKSSNVCSQSSTCNTGADLLRKNVCEAAGGSMSSSCVCTCPAGTTWSDASFNCEKDKTKCSTTCPAGYRRNLLIDYEEDGDCCECISKNTSGMCCSDPDVAIPYQENYCYVCPANKNYCCGRTAQGTEAYCAWR